MPHIHTEPGQADFVVGVYIVFENKVLLRMHEKHHQWFSVGGHVELNETPEEAAVREVKEEVGLDVVLWSENRENIPNPNPGKYQELIPPYFLNIHNISDTHRHIQLSYFASSDSDIIIEPDTHEKSGGCLWLTKEELEKKIDVDSSTKWYALKALEVLGR